MLRYLDCHVSLGMHGPTDARVPWKMQPPPLRRPSRFFTFKDSATTHMLLLASVLGLTLATPGYTQPREDAARNTIYVELGGSGILYSLNAEHLFTDVLALRAGVSYTSILGGNILTVPATASVLIELPNRAADVEIGAGLTLVTDDEHSRIIGTGIIGLRHQPKNGGFFFRFAVTPFFLKIENAGDVGSRFFLLGGVPLQPAWAFGYSF